MLGHGVPDSSHPITVSRSNPCAGIRYRWNTVIFRYSASELQRKVQDFPTEMSAFLSRVPGFPRMARMEGSESQGPDGQEDAWPTR